MVTTSYIKQRDVESFEAQVLGHHLTLGDRPEGDKLRAELVPGRNDHPDRIIVSYPQRFQPSLSPFDHVGLKMLGRTVEFNSERRGAELIAQALGIDASGEPDIDREFDVSPCWDILGRHVTRTSLRLMAAQEVFAQVREQVFANVEVQEAEIGASNTLLGGLLRKRVLDEQGELFRQWMKDWGVEMDVGETLQQAFSSMEGELRKSLATEGNPTELQEMVEQRARELYETHWRSVVGPFVVPIDMVCHHEFRLWIADWDGDPRRLPMGLVVADKSAEPSIREAALPHGCYFETIEPMKGQPFLALCRNGRPLASVPQSPDAKGQLRAALARGRIGSLAHCQSIPLDLFESMRLLTEVALSRQQEFFNGNVWRPAIEIHAVNEDGSCELLSHSRSLSFPCDDMATLRDPHYGFDELDEVLDAAIAEALQAIHVEEAQDEHRSRERSS